MQVRKLERLEAKPIGFGYADAADLAYCQALHRRYGTSYYLATCRFPKEIRRRTHAAYAFVRVPDEWVDNPGDLSEAERLHLLEDWRAQLLHGLEGVRPSHPAMRAFCDVSIECAIPLEEPLRFLDSMHQDLYTSRYATYQELCTYMRGSASAVGVMMCRLMDATSDIETLYGARALGEAMQLTNFLRDVGEDAERGRIYLPLEDLQKFGVREEEILEGMRNEGFRNLMKFEIDRARALYREADKAIPILPRRCRPAVQLARCLYSRILDKIEANDYDVFSKRARTSNMEKLILAARTLARS